MWVPQFQAGTGDYSTQGVVPSSASPRRLQRQPTVFNSVCGNRRGRSSVRGGESTHTRGTRTHGASPALFTPHQAWPWGGRSGVKLSPSQGLECCTGKHLPERASIHTLECGCHYARGFPSSQPLLKGTLHSGRLLCPLPGSHERHCSLSRRLPQLDAAGRHDWQPPSPHLTSAATHPVSSSRCGISRVRFIECHLCLSHRTLCHAQER